MAPVVEPLNTKIAVARAKAADIELKALQTESSLKGIQLKDNQFGEVLSISMTSARS